MLKLHGIYFYTNRVIILIRKIQSKILPNDWLQRVKNFDIEKSYLTEAQKTILNRIKEYILDKKMFTWRSVIRNVD